MRERQKQDLIELTDTMRQGLAGIPAMLAGGEKQEALELLTDCQDAAISIGGCIEESEGEGTEAVRELEQFCELVYQCSQEQDALRLKKLCRKAEARLTAAADRIRYEFPDERIAVFLPYKASMWDSLESVYLAACEDEGCTPMVIPIPYFDRNRDGSLRKMYYEGNQYPSEIPVVSWESVDLESLRPEMIFIHNPYDEKNYVTSVHPRFYAKRLRACTDMLVYIPYFLLEDIHVGDQAAIEGMKHFCIVPGVLYAHRVIVQSEDMRQIYIEEYLKFAKEIGMPADRAALEEKILGLGSPKTDKVRQKDQEAEIPEEWKRILFTKDGTKKKTIFYNTSVGTLLKNGDLMLAKIKKVLQVFRENRENVALLWRPHPLMQETILAMRPSLYEHYEKIVEDYCKEGWGIYDDTPDLHRAIRLSDAYYGDPSSLVPLCKESGMPVMIQNPVIMGDG